MIPYSLGLFYCFMQAILWSALPILAKLGYATVSPLLSLAIMNSFAFVTFGSLMVLQRRWRELLVREAWPFVLCNAVCNGLVYYTLVFFGTKLSTAGNAAILLLLEAPLAVVLLGGAGHDIVTKKDIIGTVLMIGAAAILAFPEKWEWNLGDLLLIIACVPPIYGNLCSRRARKSISATSIMFFRTLLITPCFWLAALTFEQMPTSSQMVAALPVLFLNGFIVIGFSRLMWIEAIQVVPISKANSLSSIAPFFTLIGAWLFLGDVPSRQQIVSLVPMLLGLHILIQASNPPDVAENAIVE